MIKSLLDTVASSKAQALRSRVDYWHEFFVLVPTLDPIFDPIDRY